MKMVTKFMLKMVKYYLKTSKSQKGTDIKVESLFYNTPARLKYIKSLYTELGKITDIVNRMAMSHPNIRFSLISDGKTMLKRMVRKNK